MLATPPSPLVIALSIAVPSVLALALAWVARAYSIRLPRWCETALAGRWAPVAAGILSAVLTLFVWGSLNEPAVVQDEQAYLLQARIFASGHWTGQTPPLSEFFEQTHVFVQPHLASKYPPGQSLVLVPGVWLDLFGLTPVVLSGLAGGLIFATARRIDGPILALLAWTLWATSRTGLYWRASYLSENTSGVLWLIALWALLGWRSESSRRHLLVVAAALAWMFLTRPLTAAGLGAPIGVYVLITARKRRMWGHVALAGALVLPILLLNFVWQQRTLGSWLTSPYAEYSREYFPSEKPGFGADLTPPSRRPPPEIAWVGQQFLALHAAHQPGALPGILLERVTVLLLALGEQWRGFLILLFVYGVVSARGPLAFGSLSAACLLLAYLIYAHSSKWVVYYAELFPVFFLIASHGLSRLMRRLAHLDDRRLQAALGLAAVLMVPWLAHDVVKAREANDVRSAFHRTAQRLLATIPDRAAVVFVHYPPGHDYHLSLIENNPDYRTARLWLVYDRGNADSRLLQLTDRPAYRLYVDTWSLKRIR